MVVEAGFIRQQSDKTKLEDHVYLLNGRFIDRHRHISGECQNDTLCGGVDRDAAKSAAGNHEKVLLDILSTVPLVTDPINPSAIFNEAVAILPSSTKHVPSLCKVPNKGHNVKNPGHVVVIRNPVSQCLAVLDLTEHDVVIAVLKGLLLNGCIHQSVLQEFEHRQLFRDIQGDRKLNFTWLSTSHSTLGSINTSNANAGTIGSA